MHRACRRPFIFLTLTVASAVACSGGTHGPQRPLQAQDLDGGLAFDAVGARSTAFAFAQAYADVARDGAERLGALVATPTLRGWAHWLDVQNREFPGRVTGELRVSSVGPATAAELPAATTSSELFRDIQMDVEEAFRFMPDEGEPFPVVRKLDGTMRMVKTPQGAWRVLDFIRDGLPMSATFQPLDGATQMAGVDLAVRLDSFVAFPAWQFNVVVATQLGFELAPKGAALVDPEGAIVAEASTTTASLDTIEPGSVVEGIVGFPLQASAAGLRFRLRFEGPRSPATVLFPLDGLIEPIPVAPPSSESPAP